MVPEDDFYNYPKGEWHLIPVWNNFIRNQPYFNHATLLKTAKIFRREL